MRRIQLPTTLEPRSAQGHKGNFGRVLVVGGSTGMIGAPCLTANAALRSGAGLVTFAVPAPIQPACATLVPCATSVALGVDEQGDLQPGAIRQIRETMDSLDIDVLAMGPGMGSAPSARDVVRAAIQWELPLVLDADGLNHLSKIQDWPRLRNSPLVLTPHPGEFSRLRGIEIGRIQQDRAPCALQAVQDWKAQARTDAPLVVLLKGNGTIVSDARSLYVNDTGNPGMATGGAGDVLTGVIAALIGQMNDPFQAACLGAWVHGRAGDLAAGKRGQVSLIATDLLDHLGQAFLESTGPDEPR